MRILLPTAVAVVCLANCWQTAAATFEIVHVVEGTGFYSSVLAAKDGSIYVVDSGGRAGAPGKIFRLAPGSTPANWTSVTLVDFADRPGYWPNGGLVADRDGELFGTTQQSDNATRGNVFSLTPPATNGKRWQFRRLHQFSFREGFPRSGPTIYRRALFGTTSDGGQFGSGTVFRLQPAQGEETRWRHTILHSFGGEVVAARGPAAGLIVDEEGTLYGTTLTGGRYGLGTIFKLTPPRDGRSWTLTVLHEFTGQANGKYPQTSLLLGDDGALYGVTPAITGETLGVAFRLAPPEAEGEKWTYRVLHRFEGGADGSDPNGPLVSDAAGALYGTTSSGGVPEGGGESYGTIFKLTPRDADKTRWRKKLLHSFTGTAVQPHAGLTIAPDGVLYGISNVHGGGQGAVFRLTPE